MIPQRNAEIARHRAAMAGPRIGLEASIVALVESLPDPVGNSRRVLDAVAWYRAWYLRQYGQSVSENYVLGAGIAAILAASTPGEYGIGLSILLNGELGRLDGGELSRAIEPYLEP